MLKFVLVTVVALFIAGTAATNVKQCKNGQPFPLSVEVVGCEEPPCELVKGTTGTIYVHFMGTKNNTSDLNANLRATLLGITVPYELPESVANVCENLMYGATCPIHKTEEVVYAFNFFVDSYYPETLATWTMSLVDNDDESIACFECGFQVKSASTNPLMLE